MMYGFWIFETVVTLTGRSLHSHSHSHAAQVSPMTTKNAKDENDETSFQKEETTVRWNSIIGILVGDVLHNVVDGLALGVSWAVGWTTGKFQKFVINSQAVGVRYCLGC